MKKTHILPERFEFVGTDVCANGNQPAQSKHQLLESWPAPEIVRDLAKFVGFIIFYSQYIPHCEVRLKPLRLIMLNEYTDSIDDRWNDAA